MEKIRIFVSYAREDKRWLQADEISSLIPWLADSLRKENIVFWYDKELVPSEVFTKRIEDEIGQAHIAILLISQAFLNSSFIEAIELPKIKERADLGELHVVPILVGACGWEENIFLSQRQMLPGRPKPLIKYINNESDWDEVRYEILAGLKRLLKIIREPQIRAELKAKNEASAVLQPEPPPILPLAETPVVQSEGPPVMQSQEPPVMQSEKSYSYEQPKTNFRGEPPPIDKSSDSGRKWPVVKVFWVISKILYYWCMANSVIWCIALLGSGKNFALLFFVLTTYLTFMMAMRWLNLLLKSKLKPEITQSHKIAANGWIAIGLGALAAVSLIFVLCSGALK